MLILKDELYNKLKYCKLSGMIEAFDRVYKETLDNNLTQLDFIEMLLYEEVINRENNRYKRLLKNASFPTIKTIDTFNFSKAAFLSKKDIMNLLSLDFLNENQNIVFIGD